jgi:D-3-phosphoglycerate dehydrogenase
MTSTMRDALNELITLPNVLVTPHIAGYSHEALFKMSLTLLKRIIK